MARSDAQIRQEIRQQLSREAGLDPASGEWVLPRRPLDRTGTRSKAASRAGRAIADFLQASADDLGGSAVSGRDDAFLIGLGTMHTSYLVLRELLLDETFLTPDVPDFELFDEWYGSSVHAVVSCWDQVFSVIVCAAGAGSETTAQHRGEWLTALEQHGHRGVSQQIIKRLPEVRKAMQEFLSGRKFDRLKSRIICDCRLIAAADYSARTSAVADVVARETAEPQRHSRFCSCKTR